MIGILLIAAGEFFAEIGTSIGKHEVSKKRESLYAMGFLNAIWVVVFLIILAQFRGTEFVFSIQSLPTFITRAVFEIILVFVGLNAIIKADRSTFSFLRTLTIPLLLITDLSLGYAISTQKIFGLGIITVTIAFLFLNHGLSGKGKFLSLLSAVLAVGTISLYKYNITHYNSVEAEQILMYIIIIAALLIGARVRTGENLFKYLGYPVFMYQSLAAGLANVLISFAYLFAPASIITAAKRSLEVLASIISGRIYFRENRVALKLVAFFIFIVGMILMVS